MDEPGVSKFNVKRFAFTWWVVVSPPVYDSAKMKYLCYGVEECPSTGRPHLQCYVEFHKKQYARAALRILDPNDVTLLPDGKRNIRFEKAFADGYTNRRYCQKKRDCDLVPNAVFHEWGTVPRDPSPVKEKISETVARMICDEDASLLDVYDAYPAYYARSKAHVLNLLEARALRRKVRCDRYVLWICGAPGSGKTKFTETHWPFVHPTNHKDSFYHAYVGQRVAIFDDFRPSDIKLNEFLRITQQSVVAINVKGSTMYFTSEVVVFTCVDDPLTAFRKLQERWERKYSVENETVASTYKEDLRQITRRFSEFGCVVRMIQDIPFEMDLVDVAYKDGFHSQYDVSDRVYELPLKYAELI